ncbi:MAG: phosphotransferase enzyme family protein [Bacteroidia bacterium]
MNLLDYDRPAILKEACDAFQLNYEQATLIRSYSNLVYDCGDYILRLTHPQERQEDEVKAEVDWMQFLVTKKLPVARCKLSIHDRLTEQVSAGDEQLTAVCLDKIIGTKISNEQWDNAHFHNLGFLVGKMHAASKQYPSARLHKHWNETPKSYVIPLLPADDRKLPELFQTLSETIQDFPASGINYGVVHYDLHHGNYLMSEDDGDPYFFDFEMACQNWYMNDVATVLYYALMHAHTRDEVDFEERFMLHFCKGYQSHNWLDSSELNWVPTFLLYRDLLVFGYLHRIWDVSKIDGLDKDFFDRISSSIDKRRAALGL